MNEPMTAKQAEIKHFYPKEECCSTVCPICEFSNWFTGTMWNETIPSKYECAHYSSKINRKEIE